MLPSVLASTSRAKAASSRAQPLPTGAIVDMRRVTTSAKATRGAASSRNIETSARAPSRLEATLKEPRMRQIPLLTMFSLGLAFAGSARAHERASVVTQDEFKVGAHSAISV